MAAALDRAARAFLSRHRVARLATSDAGGIPHVVPFCYALSGPHVYFVVDDKPKRRHGRALKRMRNIAENPSVAFVVDDWSEDWSALAFLLVRGQARIVVGARERQSAIRALRARYPQYRTMALDGGDHPVVRIAPTAAHFWRANVTARGDGARSPRPDAIGDPPKTRRRRSPPRLR